MGRAVGVLVAVGLVLAVWRAAPGGAADVGATALGSAVHPDSDFVPWVPSESWEGGRQYDPRLERRVKFWGAGMPLKDVFEGIREQTGVEIGFWPPGDMNERVCVNLYLNPENPATLRELMAQLSWVTDCTFGVSGEEEEPSYFLLATSMAGGAVRRLTAEQEANVKALRARSEQLRSENRKKLAEKLPEVRRALQLSRQELIERYRGVDDLLLLALLDRRRRRLVEFVLGLPQADQDALLEGQPVRRRWEEWSPRQRSELGAILESTVEYWDPGDHKLQAEQGTLDWAAELPLEVVIGLPGARSFHVYAGRWGAMTGPHVRLVDGQEPWYPEDRIDLREALGEAATQAERNALYEEWEENYQARSRARRQERIRETLEERFAAQRPLRRETEGLLSSLVLAGAFANQWSLWQLQEVVAAESGMHVVSDCFWQPRRDLREVIELLYPEQEPEMTGLLAVRLSALSTVKPERLLNTFANNDRAGWEWEDAGEFLRSRHLARDLWRAAFLPEDRLRELDDWLKPYVVEAVESGRDEISVAVSVDIRKVSQIAALLDDFQLYHGAKVVYGDPTDVEEAYRQTLREEVLGATSRWGDWYRLFGTFSEHQWEGLCGTGLRWREDLTPDQQAGEVGSFFSPFRERLQSCVMRLSEGGAMQDRGWGEIPGVKETYVLEFVEREERPREPALPGSIVTREGAVIPEVQLPRTIVVHLKRPGKSGDATSAATEPAGVSGERTEARSGGVRTPSAQSSRGPRGGNLHRWR